MGDFSNGIDMQNNMLSEMQGFNSDIAEHTKTRNKGYDDIITAARTERQEVGDPKQLGETATMLGQTAQGVLGSSTTLKDVYGGSKLAFAKGLGRTGDETTFGGKTLLNVGRKVVGKLSGGAEEPLEEAPRPLTKVPTALGDAEELDEAAPAAPKLVSGSAARAEATLGSSGGEATAEAAAPAAAPAAAEGSGEAVAARVAAPTTEAAQVVAPTTETAASGGSEVGGVIEAAEPALEEAAPSALRVGAGIAGNLVGKAGIGLGILSGGEALMSDIMGGKVQGDDAGEKTGNKLAIAGGVLDTLGLAVPPLAILGGIAGIASAIFTGEGHLKHAQTTADAAEAGKAKPGETPMEVTSMASLGQVASRGTDITHSIAGTSAF